MFEVHIYKHSNLIYCYTWNIESNVWFLHKLMSLESVIHSRLGLIASQQFYLLLHSRLLPVITPRSLPPKFLDRVIGDTVVVSMETGPLKLKHVSVKSLPFTFHYNYDAVHRNCTLPKYAPNCKYKHDCTCRNYLCQHMCLAFMCLECQPHDNYYSQSIAQR